MREERAPYKTGRGKWGEGGVVVEWTLIDGCPPPSVPMQHTTDGAAKQAYNTRGRHAAQFPALFLLNDACVCACAWVVCVVCSGGMVSCFPLLLPQCARKACFHTTLSFSAAHKTPNPTQPTHTHTHTTHSHRRTASLPAKDGSHPAPHPRPEFPPFPLVPVLPYPTALWNIVPPAACCPSPS